MWIFLTAVFLVLVFFLYRHPKTTLKVIGLAAVALLAIGVLLFAYDSWNRTTSTSGTTLSHFEREAKVLISVNYNEKACGPKLPLAVLISNSADKILERVEWYMGAYIPGRSSNLASNSRYVSDYILQPNKMISYATASSR